MFRRELLIVALALAAFFMLVAAAGWYVIREVNQTSRLLVVDTLPGLVDAGLARERMNDNRRIMRDLLTPHTAGERAQMIELVKTNSTENLWQDYTNSIFENNDRQNFETMMRVRSNYLQGCDEYFDLVRAEKMDEAAQLFNGDLFRRFLSYSDSARKLFDYNAQQATARGNIVIQASRYAPWIFGGICVLMFVLGMIFGLRSAWSGGQISAKR